ncbi:hypothetical protein BLJ79_05240 [Arthrobacter sp. UCD-GKA]|nr:hypothetical protein BLJ79_05240 [Arthrobacter sp. UCD-GKA]
MDHYEFLGVGRSASPNQINAAARLAIWRNRSDARLTERIMGAWYIVGDPDRRFDYDFWLLTGPSPGESYPPVERGVAASDVAEPPVPPAAPVAAPPRRVTGPLPPERVAGIPDRQLREAEPEPPATPGPTGTGPVPPGDAPAATAPRFDPERLSWWEESLGGEEKIGPGHNLLRVLVVLGLVAGVLGSMLILVAAPAPIALVPIGLCAAGLVLVSRFWPYAATRRSVDQRVFGVGGGALSNGRSRFRKENIAKGVIGERRTALALESLLRIPGTRIFHGLRFPGSSVADIDHAVVNGDRVLFIDSKFWKPGEYRWLDADKLGYVRGRRVDRRDIHMDHVQRHPLTSSAATEVGCHVLIHPNDEGAITFTAGAHISPTGIPATGIQDGIEMIGRWLMQGQKCGLVDRYVMARMIALLK